MKFKKIYESIKPSEAQIKAGNYKKKHIKWQGFDISIENEAGTYREGTDSDDKTWKTKMYYDYGYIKGTEGKDKDHIDVFIGPDTKSEIIFVINQINQKTGNFDEHKFVIGCHTKDEAINVYLKNYEKNWKAGEVIGISLDKFKYIINKNDGKLTKPIQIHEEKNITDKNEWMNKVRSKHKKVKFDRISQYPDIVAFENGKQVGYWDSEQLEGIIDKGLQNLI